MNCLVVHSVIKLIGWYVGVDENIRLAVVGEPVELNAEYVTELLYDLRLYEDRLWKVPALLVLSYLTDLLKAQAAIVTAEAKSEHWVTATWRPVTMLCFVAATMAHWFGLTPDTLTPETVENMFTLIQIGLGGYVVGRSAEKVVPGLVKALKSKDKT